MTFRSAPEDHGEFFVEWQIAEDDDLVDLSAEAFETEVVLTDEKPVNAPR